MVLEEQTVTIFGGTGFIGRYVVKEIARLGCKINVLTRCPNNALFLKTCGSVGQIKLIKGSINNRNIITNLIKESSIIINMVGIQYERKKGDFAKYHAQFPEFLAQTANEFNLKRLIHISALGINNTSSQYASTKLEGENAIIYNFPNAAILRPSVVFGEDDRFFNKFAKFASISPFLPLIGGGKTKFQPVYVNDIAESIVKIIKKQSLNRQTYELGGPNIYNFKEILDFVQESIGKKRTYINLPFGLAKLIGSVLEKLPNPILSKDKIKLLQTDSTTKNRTKTFYDLGIQPKSTEEIVPLYLDRYKNHCYHISE